MDMGHKIIEGSLDAKGFKFAIVVARFNSFVTDHLLEGALDGLKRHGANPEEVDVYRVPGSWEMPVVAAELARAKKHDAIICVGAVVRGETPHFDYVAGNAASGLARVTTETGVPVAFGVLTTNTFDQAVDRAGGKGGNKGYDAACTAIEMAHLLRGIRWAK
jgi:6,7-dimethyl-8-ribityllumazine synthase